MRDFLIKLLSFGTNSTVDITLFSVWHMLYIFVILGAIVGAAFVLKNKSVDTKTKVLNILAIATVVSYVIDFFLQPLLTSDGTLEIDKLPFHICTLMGIMAVFAQFSKKKWLKEIVVPLAFAGSMMYITYPGTALGGIAPWTYKVVQTFLFHGLLLAWAVLSSTTGSVELKWNKIWRALVALVVMAVWASIGNSVYSNANHHFDWFFLTGSTFPFIPTLLMPLAVITAVFGMIAIFYVLHHYVFKKFNK